MLSVLLSLSQGFGGVVPMDPLHKSNGFWFCGFMGFLCVCEHVCLHLHAFLVFFLWLCLFVLSYFNLFVFDLFLLSFLRFLLAL